MASTVTSSSVGTSETTPDSVRLFSWPDYVVFSLSLTIPMLVGVFFFILSLKKPSTEEFLLGGRTMNPLVVSMSMVASLLNGIFIIGQPAEIHYFGVGMAYGPLGLVIGVVAVCHVFVAKYQKMMITSAYQYVERRYNLATRVMASAFFCISIVLFLAVVLYVPALAFSQVSNFSFYWTIVITGLACTIYTTIGGIRAVLWTDAIQMMILLCGLITIAIVGAIRVGGGSVIWEVAKRDGRANFNIFSFDPRTRVTFWTNAIGGGISHVGAFTSNQMMVQRLVSVPTALKAQISLYGTILVAVPLFMLIVFIGLTMHAFYADCDPLIQGSISTGDKIVPLYLMELTGDFRGIPGLLMSSVFAAALSSVSSIINSLSAVCLEDFVDPAVMHFRQKKLSDRIRKWIAVGIVLFFGVITIGLSLLAEKFAAQVVQSTSIAWGVLGGPLGGIFVMGFLLPFVNSWGAMSGMVVGLGMALWVSMGALVNGPWAARLSLGMCVANQTYTPTTPAPTNPLSDWYGISYSWYVVVGMGTCIIVGIIVSLATGGFSHEYRSSRDPAIMFSMADKCCCCCPMSCRKCYRCGVMYDDEEEIKLEKFDRIDLDYQYFQQKRELENGRGKENHAYITDPEGTEKKESKEIVALPNGNDHKHIQNGINGKNSVYVIDSI